MILVDIGNSGVRALRCSDGGDWDLSKVVRLSWPANLNTRHKSTPQQQSGLNQLWCDSTDLSAFRWLAEHIDAPCESTWYISSVHQGAFTLLRDAAMTVCPSAELRVITYRDVPMELDVEHPERTGIDRILSSWEGWTRANRGDDFNNVSNRSVIVAQAGTALTVDAVSRNGVFRGGAILPGLGLSLQFLAAGTDQLPWISNHLVTKSPKLPGRNTLEAIAAGVHASLVGGASHLVQAYRSQSEWQDAIVMITGGDGNLLVPYVEPPVAYQEHLVLRALHRIATGRTP
ncbi:type III pantothenate kinase [Pirellulaceae bacterium SH467]|jgi:type III pantothenate kinase